MKITADELFKEYIPKGFSLEDLLANLHVLTSDEKFYRERTAGGEVFIRYFCETNKLAIYLLDENDKKELENIDCILDVPVEDFLKRYCH